MNTDRLLEQSWHQIQLGHFDGAIHTLKELLSIYPDIAEAHAYLALCLLSKKRIHAAASEAGMALALNAELELSHYVMAHVLIGKRQLKDAERHISHLLDSSPNNAEYYLLKADFCHLAHRQGEMLPLLEKALELDPESPKVLAELSAYYTMVGQLDEAESRAYESLHLEPSNVSGLVAMGNVLLRRGRTEEAREHAIWALRQEPDNHQALFLISNIKARKNPLLGLWWRYNTWMSSVGSARSILVLLFAFIIYKMLTMIAGDLGKNDVASLIHYVWLGLVIYTFIGPTLFLKTLKRELDDVKLKEEF